MKNRYFFMFFSLFLWACKKGAVEIVGQYANESASAYSRAFDTLEITKEDNETNVFSVERRVSFQRIRNGKFLSKEYKLENWVALYDEKTNVLTDMKKGRMIECLPKKKKLLLGNTAYLKIK
jgi:hypothetical protein